MSTNSLDQIHIIIHGLRMLPNYSPDVGMQKVNKIICEEYKNECTECKERLARLQQPVQNGGVFG